MNLCAMLSRESIAHDNLNYPPLEPARLEFFIYTGATFGQANRVTYPWISTCLMQTNKKVSTLTITRSKSVF